MMVAQQTPPSPSHAPSASTASIGPVSHIIPPPANFVIPEETYVYNAEWRIWTAGTVTLGISREGAEQRVSGTAESAGVVSMLYPVHDRFQALYDPKTFCSLSLHKHTEEGLHKRDTLISYIYSRGKAVLDETNLKNNEPKHVENDIPGCVTDVISGLMYLRSLPLLVDSSYTFPVNDGGKTVDVTAKVEAKETIKVPAGTFKTIRVSPESGNNFKLKGKIWIWYTDDARRIPVMMRGKMFWGTLDFKLTRIDNKK
ncbi:MAG TPA: DUF3108 domain-containing protein [Terriglobales bacterium]|nr:DUF3108 domain-containing protein [Terriglobales bacterium]